MTVRLEEGDCREVIKTLADASIDACVTDPPYSLVSIQNRFGKTSTTDPTKTSERSRDRSDAYARTATGFMGKKWDTGEVAHDPAFWAEVYRVLKPGAHLVAFGGMRTYHRLACAIEDAGFEIRDSVLNIVAYDSAIAQFLDTLNDKQRGAFFRCIEESGFGGLLAWCFGTGFPKSHDISKAIDKAAGAEREIIGIEPRSAIRLVVLDQPSQKSYRLLGDTVLTTPSSDAARTWSGYGTALKPAFEPIVLARKPLAEGSIAANVLAYGTGAINIDGCRIGTSKDVPASPRRADQGSAYGDLSNASGDTSGFDPNLGRWPANVVHDGSDEVLEGFPDRFGAISNSSLGDRSDLATNFAMGSRDLTSSYADSGSAARFFFSSKADTNDRFHSKHPTVKPVSLIAWLVKLITPPGGVFLDPFAGSGTAGAAALETGRDAILIEREPEYIADIRERLAAYQGESRLGTPSRAARKKPGGLFDLYGEGET